MFSSTLLLRNFFKKVSFNSKESVIFVRAKTLYIMNIGEIIKDLRNKAEPKVSQKDLADAVGVHHNHISMIELGKTKPGFELASEIIKALGYSVVFRRETIDEVQT